MKTKLCSLFIVPLLFAGVHQAMGQLPVISSFSQNGVLVCTNLQPRTVASVEWASSLSGPWNTNWAGLDAVTVDTNGMIQVSVPMFYRVRAVLLVTNAVPTNMALITAGAFTMGDSLDGESDATPISVTVSSFFMDTNLVSYGQWQAVYNWATNHEYGFVNAGAHKATNHPVQTVDWYDVVKWCNARSQQAGLMPVYYTDAGLTQVYTNGEVTPYVNWTNSGYRLPTEAEWEKAARGGLSGQRFPWGNTISESQANYYGNTSYGYDLGPNGYNTAFTNGASPYTSPVGYFSPNGYGLYDMAGNVSEWCWDWYSATYLGGSDPHGPAYGVSRVWRGGYWEGYAIQARCAYRWASNPTNANYYIGFRCAQGL